MTILSLSAKRNIRNAALSALHYIAYESECEVADILALLTEPPRADAPAAQTAPLPTVQTSPAGVDAVASPATNSNAPDEQAVAGEGSPALDPAFHSPETAPENAPAQAQADGEDPSSSAPNPDALPPPERSGASDAAPSDEAGEVPPPMHGASPAPIRKRDLVVQCAADHPDWSHQQIADHLGLSRGSVSGNLALARQKGEKSPQEPAEAVPPSNAQSPQPATERQSARKLRAPDGTLSDRVRYIHERYPSLTAALIAKELGAYRPSVAAILSKIKGERAEAEQAKPEFSGRRELIDHYDSIAKRLGKV